MDTFHNALRLLGEAKPADVVVRFYEMFRAIGTMGVEEVTAAYQTARLYTIAAKDEIDRRDAEKLSQIEEALFLRMSRLIAATGGAFGPLWKHFDRATNGRLAKYLNNKLAQV